MNAKDLIMHQEKIQIYTLKINAIIGHYKINSDYFWTRVYNEKHVILLCGSILWLMSHKNGLNQKEKLLYMWSLLWLAEMDLVWPEFVDRKLCYVAFLYNGLVICYSSGMGLLPDTQNCGLRMRSECRKGFTRHRGLAILTCITARAWHMCRDAYRDR